jgi:hypothetical protein
MLAIGPSHVAKSGFRLGVFMTKFRKTYAVVVVGKNGGKIALLVSISSENLK